MSVSEIKNGREPVSCPAGITSNLISGVVLLYPRARAVLVLGVGQISIRSVNMVVRNILMVQISILKLYMCVNKFKSLHFFIKKFIS